MQADNNMQYCEEVISCTCEGRLCQTVQSGTKGAAWCCKLRAHSVCIDSDMQHCCVADVHFQMVQLVTPLHRGERGGVVGVGTRMWEEGGENEKGDKCLGTDHSRACSRASRWTSTLMTKGLAYSEMSIVNGIVYKLPEA